MFYSLVAMVTSTQCAQFELPWTLGNMGMASLHRQVGFQLVLFAEWASGAVPIGRWREAGGRYLAVKELFGWGCRCWSEAHKVQQ